MPEVMTTAGIILIDKPAGISSAKAIAEVKKRLNIKKIGHAGTLDPMATGLLVCLIGSATRLAHYAEEGEKVYSGTIDFGYSTDTDDVEGDVLTKSDSLPSMKEIEAASKSFIGNILQTPPQVSALRVKGKRAYQYAREGIQLDLPKREVVIPEFNIDADIKANEKVNRVRFTIRCSKGTYIRSVARDLGGQLGCGGCLSSLRREESYPFTVINAKAIEDLTRDDIVDWSELFPTTEKVKLTEHHVGLLTSGNLHALNEITENLPSTLKKAVYYSSETGIPYGLLLKEGSNWRIGVNICQV